MKQLSLSARPKTLDALVGQGRLVKLIRRGVKKSIPKGLLFVGERGTGKTSIARIIALSLQCTHQDKFGRPCIQCRRNKTTFPIYEINCARIRGVEELEDFIKLADSEILGKGRRKVFILDEAHMLSKHSQNLLLVPLEETHSNVVWIICSTAPEKILATVRSRCKTYTLRGLKRDDVLAYTTDLLGRLESELSPEDITDALVENSVSSPRLIAHAVEAYEAGASAEEAADVDGSTEISSKALCRAVIKGDWEETRIMLQKSGASEVRALRASIIGYLTVILLESGTVDDRSRAVATSIKNLAYIGVAEDNNQQGALASELHSLCDVFSNYGM